LLIYDKIDYVPCTTPLNITLTLDDRPEIPLHPLDLTTEPATGNQAQFCTGLIQADDGNLAVANNKIGDMILGVPFMRNVYTVMAYTQPNPDGSFPFASNASSSSSSSSAASELSSTQIQPRLGFLPLTDPTIALEEFRTVRVLNQPISTGVPGAGGGGAGGGSSSSFHAAGGGRKLSVGIIILLGLLGFFVVCVGMFGVWRFVVRAREKKVGVGVGVDRGGGREEGKAGYPMVDMPSEDRLRAMRYEAYMKKEQRITSGSTMSSGQTRVGGGGGVDEHGKKVVDDEQPGVEGEEEEDIDMWDPKTALAWGGGNDTLGRERSPPPPTHHARTRSEFGIIDKSQQLGMGAAFPLLGMGYEAHPHHHHQPSDDFPAGDGGEFTFSSLSELDHRSVGEGVDEFGVGGMGGGGMAGVGTASRTSKIDAGFQRDSVVSAGTVVGGDRYSMGSGRDFVV
jgi:hypothetical protein